MSRLIIYGASGHGKVVADIAKKCNYYDDVVVFDDNYDVISCGEYEVQHSKDLLFRDDDEWIIAIGNSVIRKNKMEQYKDYKYATLIHPSAVIADDVKIGIGSVIMAGAVINPGSVIGKGVIINTCSSVDHDCVVGDYVHVAVGAHLCGTVNVGESTWIGAGATVSNNVNICGECMIGAGAVVVKDIKEKGTYVGVPAEIIKG